MDVRRRTIDSIKAFAAEAEVLAQATVTSRSSVKLKAAPGDETSNLMYIASAKLDRVSGSEPAPGAEVDIYVSHTQDVEGRPQTRPALDAALQPGAKALVGLTSRPDGRYQLNSASAFLISEDASVTYIGPACTPSVADAKVSAETQGLRAHELWDVLSQK